MLSMLIAMAQAAVTAPPGAVVAVQPAAVVAPAATVTIPQDTPVELMAASEISTASVKAGQRFRLRLNKPLIVGGRTLALVGATAFGEVTSAEGSGSLGKSGKMTARLLHLQIGDAEVPLQGDVSAKGTGAGSAGLAVLFAGLSGLFHRGNNAKIKAGEILMGFVREPVTLDLSGPVARLATK